MQKLQTPRTEWRYRYNPFGEREQKRMYNSPLGDMGYGMYPWVYYQLGIDNKQYAVYYGAQTNNSYVNMSNITMTAKPDPNRETVFFYPVEYNVYGNESSPKITYKYIDGYWQKQYKIYDYLGSLRYTISQMNKVLNYKAYDPYGNEIIDTMKQTRQGYIGKENDVENGLGDHGVRKYDPGTGRFNSVDPMWEKFPGISPYVYCFNNPIRLIDWNGFLPGDPFDTEEQAAHDFGKNYNNLSFAIGGEISTNIYKYQVDGKNKFTYAIPNAMCEVGGNPDLSTIDKEGYTKTAAAHTHGPKDPFKDSENFSPKDKIYKFNLYLITPGGDLKLLDFKHKKVETITKDMPKDDGSSKKGNWKKVENNPDKRPLPIYLRSDQGMVNINDAKSETEINRGY